MAVDKVVDNSTEGFYGEANGNFSDLGFRRIGIWRSPRTCLWYGNLAKFRGEVGRSPRAKILVANFSDPNDNPLCCGGCPALVHASPALFFGVCARALTMLEITLIPALAISSVRVI